MLKGPLSSLSGSALAITIIIILGVVTSCAQAVPSGGTPVPIPVATPDPTPTETPPPTPTVTPVAVPSYIAQIGVWDAASGELYGRGNAFLVHEDKRLFATSAHITEGDLKGKFFRIQINGVWYPAHTEEAWINWHADGAIFRLEAPEDLVLPASARLGDTPPEDSDVWVVGYLPDPNLSHMLDAPLTPYSVEASVISRDVEWTITFDALAERALLMDEFLASLPEGTVTFEIPRALRGYYYRHFVMIMQKELTYERRFRPGTSGMPLVREGEEVVGMVAASMDILGIFFGTGGNAALAIPIEEIKKLRDKVIGMLE